MIILISSHLISISRYRECCNFLERECETIGNKRRVQFRHLLFLSNIESVTVNVYLSSFMRDHYHSLQNMKWNENGLTLSFPEETLGINYFLIESFMIMMERKVMTLLKETGLFWLMIPYLSLLLMEMSEIERLSGNDGVDPLVRSAFQIAGGRVCTLVLFGSFGTDLEMIYPSSLLLIACTWLESSNILRWDRDDDDFFSSPPLFSRAFHHHVMSIVAAIQLPMMYAC